MPAKFASVDDFAIRAGLGTVDDLAEDVQNKARYALEAATTHLVSYIRTEFDARSVVDQYYVDIGELPFQGDFPKFYLSQGFVTTPVSSMTIRTSDQLPEVGSATAIDASYLRLDANKGTVLITGTDRLPINALSPVSGDRYFAQIEYDAGFTTQADAFGTLYENAPDYLAEAAVILAKQIFDNGQPCKDGDATGANGCPCTIEHLITRYIRFVPSALKPLF
jgi:hypothetical protein